MFKPQAPVQPSKGKGTAHRPLAKESILNNLNSGNELDIFGNVIPRESNATTSVSSNMPLPHSTITNPSNESHKNYLPRKPSMQDFNKYSFYDLLNFVTLIKLKTSISISEKQWTSSELQSTQKSYAETTF